MESLPPNNSAGTSHSLCNLSDTLIPELKIYLDRHRGSLRQELDNSPETSGIGLSARYAKVVDGLLMSLYEAARAAHGADSVLGLAAVGSYGRNTLTLSSDLDVRVLANGDAQECAKIAEALIYPLWDVGLDVGHQIVTEPQLIELAKSDLPTATTLLDWRYLGSQTQEQKAVLRRVLDAVFDDVGMERFLAQLTTIGVERRHRYGGSIYLLEPDIKNGTGGIRDWDFAHWVARARWRVRELASLQEMGVLIQREAEDLRQATDFISKLRNQLHGIVNRKVDRLGFEQQEALAKKLGYGDGGSAVEQLMSAYYRNARIVERTMELLIARAAPPPKYRPREQDLGDGTKIVGSSIALVDPDAIFREPSLALRIFDQAARHGFPAQESARIAVMRATSNPEFCEVMRNDKECCRLFTKLLCTKSRTEFKNGSPLSELHDVGILLALIPEFAPVVGRAHHDIYHVYTVDVHSIFAVDFLRARCRGDQANVYPLASRLATEIARPQVLFFAILLHDVGKALGGKNHSERGAVMAESILKRFELAPHDIEQVQHLIQKHLRMYHVATRRDIDDPQAIADFCAEEITGLEGLRELYLLSICDVATTNPGNLNSWKSRMMDELYHAAQHYLSNGPTPDNKRISEAMRAIQERLPNAEDQLFAEHYLGSLPERYLLSNTPDVIIAHLAMAQRTRHQRLAVEVVEILSDYYAVAVVCDDRTGLLVDISASLSGARCDVNAAQIFSWIDPEGKGRAIDIFWICREEYSEPSEVAALLEKHLLDLMDSKVELSKLISGANRGMRWSSRPAPLVASEVSIDILGSEQHTVIEVLTKDRRDLLFHLAKALRSLDLEISVAKLNTEGDRVADIFYVTDQFNHKITDREKLQNIREYLLQMLQNLD